ncbi:A-kinase-interacting protein 1 isoform X2 [Gallus gallus]|uniref:A-kinase-interacting protein 1 isoform X2 n=1 Tax=Gallus gallus TaxID=9031 RepID=UPI001AE14308|nr:A-kinase-interacting protein 1 isoform X2 [Gallus gallus]XP_040529311.1 A-kinase-interacting protein 1 isoform X2 [Gallus gallus]
MDGARAGRTAGLARAVLERARRRRERERAASAPEEDSERLSAAFASVMSFMAQATRECEAQRARSETHLQVPRPASRRRRARALLRPEECSLCSTQPSWNLPAPYQESFQRHLHRSLSWHLFYHSNLGGHGETNPRGGCQCWTKH